MILKEIIEIITRLIEIAGVLIMVIGIVYGSFAFLTSIQKSDHNAYDTYRTRIGRSILLGLELLVAADILNTVAIKPTMKSVLVLGLIVIIRTFLSFSLEIELEGKLPWRRKENSTR